MVLVIRPEMKHCSKIKFSFLRAVLIGCCEKTCLQCSKMAIVFIFTRFVWLSARKNSGAKDNRSLFFKAIGYCFYCSFYCFLKILGGKRLFWGGGKSRFGGTPCPSVAESQFVEPHSLVLKTLFKHILRSTEFYLLFNFFCSHCYAENIAGTLCLETYP